MDTIFYASRGQGPRAIGVPTIADPSPCDMLNDQLDRLRAENAILRHQLAVACQAAALRMQTVDVTDPSFDPGHPVV